MAFVELDHKTWDFVISRDLRMGGPNTGKSQSLLTNERPCYVIVYPGEKGISTFPIDEEGFKVYFWKEDEITKNKPGAIIKEVQDLTLELLSGNRAPYGPMKSFCGDGLHKFYSSFWLRDFRRLVQINADALQLPRGTKGSITEEELKIRAYGNENYGARQAFMEYVTMVYESSVPHVTFTCWEGAEPDEPGVRSSTTHIFPDFPGKLAKAIVGEFALVLYSTLSKPDPLGRVKAKWQLKPGGKVWGAGVKAELKIAERLPREVPQDWSRLSVLLRRNSLGPEITKVLDSFKKEGFAVPQVTNTNVAVSTQKTPNKV